MASSDDMVIRLGEAAADAVPEPRPDMVARRGARRMVKLVPVPGNYAVPAIWTSPETKLDDEGRPCRVVVVLMQKEPVPETMRMWVPAQFFESLPSVPVEW